MFIDSKIKEERMLSEIDCPVCKGSGRMEIIEFYGVEKRKVKIPCTACGGKGMIPFVDLTEPQETVEVDEPIKIQVDDGWRKSSNWNKVHYILKGRSLCGSIRSQKTLAQSTNWYDLDPKILCSICLKMVEKSS